MKAIKNKFTLINIIQRLWPLFITIIVVSFFFFPVFSGKIPFPGDLLMSQSPFKAYSYLGYAPGGMPNKAQGPDVINEIYPWRYFSFNQLKTGSIPFWNPHNFAGNPQMADFQTAVFYPFNLTYLILPFNLSWTLIIMLQPFLAILFMYLYLKKGLALNGVASILGSISFGFSSYMVVWMEYGNIGNTMLWLPLALLFTKYFVKKISVLNLLGIVVSLVFAILAGYIQGVFYLYIIIFLYYFYLSFIEKTIRDFKKHVIFGFALIIPLVVTLFQLLPTLLLFSQSTRGSYSLLQIEKSLVPVYLWVTAFVPDFFGNPASRNYWIDGTYIERVLYPGAVMMFFAFLAFFNKSKITEKKFFTLGCVISLFIATNLPLMKYLYLIPIPVISTTVPTRELSLFIFFVVVLGSIGLDLFLSQVKINKKPWILYISIFIFILATVLILIKINPLLVNNLKISLRNLLLPGLWLIFLCFAVFIKRFSNKLVISILFIVLVLDLLSFFNKITPFSSHTLTYPNTPLVSFLKQNAGINRYWGYGNAYIPANFQTVEGTYSPEGNDPLHISRYGELLASSLNGNLPIILPRPDANIAPGFGQEDLKKNVYRKKILDLLGVKYIIFENNSKNTISIADQSTFPNTEYNLIKVDFPWQIYENKNALPRVFITPKYIIAKNKKDALKLIYNNNIDLRKTIILESKPKLILDTNAKAYIDSIQYKPNNIYINAISTGNSLLFLSDNYYRDWKVLIDGKEAKILLADYSFRAVEFPGGKHLVEFYYSPQNFIEGIILSIIGLVLFSILIFYVKNNKKI